MNTPKPAADIRSVLHERRRFAPAAAFTAAARIGPQQLAALHRRARQDHVGFWAELARAELHWHKPFSITLDDSAAPNYRWFCDGELNVCVNCLDVHLAERGEKTAILFESEAGAVRRLSYRELHAEVCRLANALRRRGVHAGDRVVIYLPMVPEAVIAMQACARIGAIHAVVFGGFSALSLRERIEDAEPKLVITADGGVRAGAPVPLKAAVDKALSEGCASVEAVVVLRHTGSAVTMCAGRDQWWHELVAGQPEQCEPQWLPAEHPLFLLHTSGSTGKSKGIQHASAGYLLGAKLTFRWVFDLRDDDVFWCTADVGWVTGHSYVAYGPLAAGATVVMYEGAATYPDGGRFWKICQDHGVTVLYTAPTAIRALMRLGDEIPAGYDLSRLRLLGSVGEPINPEAWMWYQRVIGGGRCPVVDTWWQTETGAIMISPLPGVTATKPGSCTLPLPGVFADIVDERGKPVRRAGVGGYLVIRKPWPSLARTIWRDNERYLATYWNRFDRRCYVAGDGAYRDEDGYFWIVGRIDDVLNVAGHRLGTMEIESALVAHPRVAEAAVVGRPHEIKGEAVLAYVVCRGARPTEPALMRSFAEELRGWVAEQLSPIAKPDEIRFSEALPKTRSGKIMRRLLRAIARGQTISQDVSTLENPAIVAQLRGEDEGAAAAAAVSTRRTGGSRRGGIARRGKAAKPTAAAPRRKPGKRRPPAKPRVQAKRRTQPAKRAKVATRARPSKRVKRTKRAKVAKVARRSAAPRRRPRGRRR
ncbi:MAG TPA: acetate--CoA ligase [Steroidobacteraceae bacterium]|nr:acetate--CoA ligase [Steroidobacteraceae bacterium]